VHCVLLPSDNHSWTDTIPDHGGSFDTDTFDNCIDGVELPITNNTIAVDCDKSDTEPYPGGGSTTTEHHLHGTLSITQEPPS
jgi:hypothetical protein